MDFLKNLIFHFDWNFSRRRESRARGLHVSWCRLMHLDFPCVRDLGILLLWDIRNEIKK